MQDCLGGGYVIGTTILFGGLRGAGKSTMVLHEARAILAHREGPVIYIAGEELPAQIKSRAVRLGLTDKDFERIACIEAMGTGLECLDILAGIKPALVIADSVQGIVGEGTSGEKTALELAKALGRYVKVNSTVAMLLAHVTKDGDFAGLMSLQHEADCLLSMFPDEAQPGIVSLRTEKNRHGPSYVEQRYAMKEEGLICRETIDPRFAGEEDEKGSSGKRTRT